MIQFILGEDRHVEYFVHSVKSEYFVIKDAEYKLFHDGQLEDAGPCDVLWDEARRGCSVDAKLQPKNKSTRYMLELTLSIADEVIKNREEMEVR